MLLLSRLFLTLSIIVLFSSCAKKEETAVNKEITVVDFMNKKTKKERTNKTDKQ